MNNEFMIICMQSSNWIIIKFKDNYSTDCTKLKLICQYYFLGNVERQQLSMTDNFTNINNLSYLDISNQNEISLEFKNTIINGFYIETSNILKQVTVDHDNKNIIDLSLYYMNNIGKKLSKDHHYYKF